MTAEKPTKDEVVNVRVWWADRYADDSIHNDIYSLLNKILTYLEEGP